jgi:hypothetical protein
MSIESNLASIAASLATIAEALSKQAPTVGSVQPAPVAAPAPAPVAPVVAAPVAIPVVAPVAAPAPVANCPITDQQSLVAYVMSSYKEMGPVKGNQIQGVLAALGITNINEARAEHYPAIFAGVEALKVQ